MTLLLTSNIADIIYFDFTKAFNTVNNDLLIAKPKKNFKIEGCLLKFISNYWNLLKLIKIYK